MLNSNMLRQKIDNYKKNDTEQLFSGFDNDDFLTKITNATLKGLSTGEPVFKAIKLNPTKAKTLLGINWKHNRRINRNYVKRLAREMQGGRWALTGENALVFSSDDGKVVLINGQHRMTALSRLSDYNTNIDIHCAFGIPLDAYAKMDTGFKRGAATPIAANGSKHPAVAAAGIKRALQYIHGAAPDGQHMEFSNQEVLEFFMKHEEEVDFALHDCLRFQNRALVCSASTATGLHLAMQLECDAPDQVITDFWDEMYTNPRYREGRNPIVTVRNELFNSKLRQSQIVKAAMLVKAFSAIHGGAKNNLLNWRVNDPREAFPRIIYKY